MRGRCGTELRAGGCLVLVRCECLADVERGRGVHPVAQGGVWRWGAARWWFCVGCCWPWLGADAAWAEGADVSADLLECSGERFDVAGGEVVGEVLFDSVSVVA